MNLTDIVEKVLAQGVDQHNSVQWNRRIADVETIEDEHIVLATFSGKELAGKTFIDCTLEDCTLIDVDFEKTHFINVTFDRCMLNP